MFNLKKVEKYGLFELRIQGAEDFSATFSQDGESIEIKGCEINERETAVRFMPRRKGVWHYRAGDLQGEFLCVPNTGKNHGPVERNGYHFRYADGSAYFPIGTTCYAWIHQTPELITQTLESLENSPFNKIRMLVFPKDMPYNKNDPDLYPFLKKDDGTWDVSRPDFAFWRHLESGIEKLGELGIEADLILFHPYDRWGFSKLTHEESLIYLEYCIRRLSAYRNIWWSLANEYELVTSKTLDNWMDIGEKISKEDIYGHPISVHNIMNVFPKTDWLTHCSIQNSEVKRVIQWRKEYELPVIIDECGYEGNIEFDWGNLSGFELIHRAWTTVACGGYITHGETFFREDEVLWWAKGGKLYGESVARFAFLKEIQYEIGELTPIGGRIDVDFENSPIPSENPVIAAIANAVLNMPEWERKLFLLRMQPAVSSNENRRLHYLGRTCPAFQEIMLPENGVYRIEVLDIWEMTRTAACEGVSGKIKVPLPGKEGIVILVTRISGESLN